MTNGHRGGKVTVGFIEVFNGLQGALSFFDWDQPDLMVVDGDNKKEYRELVLNTHTHTHIYKHRNEQVTDRRGDLT